MRHLVESYVKPFNALEPGDIITDALGIACSVKTYATMNGNGWRVMTDVGPKECGDLNANIIVYRKVP